MTIIAPPGKPTVIQRAGAQTVTLSGTNRQVIGQPAAGKQVVTPCDPHPVEHVSPVSKTVELVTKGPKGDPGDPGPPGPAGGNVVQLQAVGVIGGNRVVRSVPGGVGYASNDQFEHGDDVIGISLQAGTDELINVQVAGEVVEPSWDWTPRQPVYLDTTGRMTQAAPDHTNAAFLLVIGFATSADSIMLRIESPIYF